MEAEVAVTKVLDPVCWTSEKSKVTQEWNPGRDNGNFRKVQVNMDLLNTGPYYREVDCIIDVLMILIMDVRTIILTLRPQERLFGTLDIGKKSG